MRELLVLLTTALRTQALPALSGSHLAGGAAGAGGGRSPHSHSSSGSHSPTGVSSRKALSMAAQDALQTAFAAEPGAPPLPATPFPISRLQSRGIFFAHRTRASIGEAGAGSDAPVLADFNTAPWGMLLPADPSKGTPGMSFFIVTRETPAVLRAAHAFRGVAPGRCSAYPLGQLPAALSLVRLSPGPAARCAVTGGGQGAAVWRARRGRDASRLPGARRGHERGRVSGCAETVGGRAAVRHGGLCQRRAGLPVRARRRGGGVRLGQLSRGPCPCGQRCTQACC